LDSGSTPFIKATAARQLGQIAALRVRGNEQSSGEPKHESTIDVKEDEDEEEQQDKVTDKAASSSSSNYRGTDGEWDQAIFLIARVLPHLRSKIWDTRVAAGQAIEAICSASGLWDPDLSSGIEEATTSSTNTDLLDFSTFSLSQVLSTGKKLLSSAGNEYDVATFTTVEERLAHAKRDMQRLGLGSMAGEEIDLGVDMEKELMTEAKDSSSPSKSTLPPPRFAPKTTTSNLPPPRFAPSPSLSSSTGNNGSEGKKDDHSSPRTPDTPQGTFSPAATEVDWSTLSARERNQLKRKRKMEEKASSLSNSNTTPTEPSATKVRVLDQSPSQTPTANLKVKVPTEISGVKEKTVFTPQTPSTPSAAPVDYLTAKSAPSGTTKPGTEPTTPSSNNINSLVAPRNQWPFSLVCSLLLSDLFSPKWEIRHGAALGLRELFQTQGHGGGKVIGGTRSRVKKEENDDEADHSMNNEELHTRWCEDAAIRLLCVLSLDRLGDFVFDQVIAPVRETAAQTMASLLKWMPSSSVIKVHDNLLEMVKQDFLLVGEDSEMEIKGEVSQLKAKRGVKGYAWEVRHAGLLGLKYQVTIRKDLLLENKQASRLLEGVVELAVICLRDDDDDVRGVAATTLLPIVDLIVEYLPQVIPTLMQQLWECLGDLKDDLCSSTGGVMNLLAKLVESKVVVSNLLDTNSTGISLLIPRLFPFFRHTITTVRLAVLHALQAFLRVPDLPKDWVDDRLVRLLFQNLVVEGRQSIRDISMATWQTTLAILTQEQEKETVSSRLIEVSRHHLQSFFTILMTPLGSPIDFHLFYKADSGSTSLEARNMDKGTLSQDLALIGVDTVIRGRLGAAEALGSIMAHWTRSDGDEKQFESFILQHLSSSSALQKCLAAVVVQEWAQAASNINRDCLKGSQLAEHIGSRLIQILDSPPPATYAEMVVMLQRIQSQCQGLYNYYAKDAKVPKNKIPALPVTVDTLGQDSSAFTIEVAKVVVGKEYDTMMGQIPAKTRKTVTPVLQDRRLKLITDIGFYQSIKEKQDTQVGASVAGAAIALQAMPTKLNPVIRSIMNSVKFEENVDLQQRSARAVASFIAMCSLPSARANPSDKIIKNLCAFVCQDTTQTPIFDTLQDQSTGILSMNETSTPSKGKGRGDLTDGLDGNMSEEVRVGKVIRRGAEMTLQAISEHFKDLLFITVPSLWICMTGPLNDLFGAATAEATVEAQRSQGQAVVDCCTLLQVNIKNLDDNLRPQAMDLIAPLIGAIKSHFAVVRSAAAKSLAAMADCITEQVMLGVVERVLPLLGDSGSVIQRQGAIEALSHIVSTLDTKLLPYVIVLIVPILGRMSDSDDAIRLVATNTFASLVKMVPLEAGLPDPPGFSKELLTRRQEERKFLSQLLDGSKVEPYDIPVKIHAQLRKYQQQGVNWMAFLAKFQLHGILCDDMGLGKTLQSICILAGKHHERSSQPDKRSTPSLIVCPPTLTGHWCHEIQQYSDNLQPLLYAGQPQERLRLQSQIDSHDCVVMSYDTLRNDIAELSQRDWFYCILDEGHIIKSAKTKTTKAVKTIRASHRLILSGTPIQNNVLELWSLFDFLMPGFLGSEKSFMERYGRPILASRDAKVSAKEHERASLALEALHKQVLPFLLRRMKEDVLDDLPPKIIQDITCELGEVQKQLYDDFIREQDPEALENALLEDEGGGEKKQHVFQTLQYLRKLVCHPSLVFDPTKPKHKEIEAALQKKGGKLSNIENAPKLLALKQLLNDCGIGETTSAAANGNNDAAFDADVAVSQHRVLIFCQQRKMIDLIEKDLFLQVMPSVSYMRLDGSVTTDRRFGMVQKFNSDPSIDVLLLTTSVGGLGLTLTGADTVIFVEHDWNPMKDMQAMDRAHRLGQKKVVNVYRLITKNTLEEKIMGLQRFKLNVAGSVVNQENKGTDSMDTDQILDLFDVEAKEATPKWKAGASGEEKVKGVSQKALLASIEAMADTGDDYADLQEWRG
jgi:TATA-binding protein-associated factor